MDTRPIKNIVPYEDRNSPRAKRWWLPKRNSGWRRNTSLWVRLLVDHERRSRSHEKLIQERLSKILRAYWTAPKDEDGVILYSPLMTLGLIVVDQDLVDLCLEQANRHGVRADGLIDAGRFSYYA